MKKALIITYYNSTNYGAFLQAYATQEFLNGQGVDASILEYESKNAKILGGLYGVVKGRRAESAEKKDYRNRMGKAVINAQQRLNLDLGEDQYDLAILGSDEIWNVKNARAAHDAFLFSKNKKAARTISYAACAGGSRVKHLKLFPYAIKGIKGLDAVSVRDDETENLVRAIGRKDVVRVLDPTFLYDFEAEIPNIHVNKPYLFVYSYGLSDEQARVVREVAKKHNWAVIATGSNYAWADENPAPDPFEWLAYIKNAEAVVTTTFHGTAFSIHFNKRFAVFNFRSAKVQSLLKETRLIDRRVSSWRSLDMLLDTPVDYSKVNSLLAQKRRASQSFLLSQLGLDTFEICSERGAVDANCYVARHKSSDIRWNSRSGGAFTAISDVVLDRGGVVYGALLDERFVARHGRAETKDQRDRMRGSKYVQSDLHGTLQQIISDLHDGRTVLFSGTPCQVDAVKALASAMHCDARLITMDFICHGVPSPLVWREYLGTFQSISEVDFRNKRKFGWKAHVETIVSEGKSIHSTAYTKLYHSNYCVRPSCHECPYAQYERFSDITIADCWGTERAAPGFNTDDSGVSMILPNTETGQRIVDAAITCMEVRTAPISQMAQPVLKAEGMGTCNPSGERDQFWADFHTKGIQYVCQHYSTDNAKAKLKNRLKLPHSVRFAIKKAMGRT